MRLARAWSVALIGLNATLVEVEVFFGPGLPRTVIVGMADACVQESRERCRAAVTASRLAWPATALTVNLSPASVPKAGSHYDLPLVAGVLVAGGDAPSDLLEGTVFLGELSLDGRVRPVRGVLPAVLAARDAGFERVVVPAAQLGEARLVSGIAVVGVATLLEVVAFLKGEPLCSSPAPVSEGSEPDHPLDLADVHGQAGAKWALEVAAAGGHHVWLTGPPGVGKTLLAERLTGLLPDLDQQASQEVSAIHSLLGRSLEGGLMTRPPYADPHHTVSVAALVGGGSRVAVPGAVSRAHHGVLFLDEAPEFSIRALESLRQPLESGVVVHARVHAQVTFPARFQLVLSSNPCPCGWHGVAGGQPCACTPFAVRRYAERLSGPILDRVDIRHWLVPLTRSYLRNAPPEEPSAVVAERVAAARDRQRHRLAKLGYTLNATVPGGVLRKELPLPSGSEVLDDAVRRGHVSARGVDKVLRLSWTLADLAGRDIPSQEDVVTALALRRGEE